MSHSENDPASIERLVHLLGLARSTNNRTSEAAEGSARRAEPLDDSDAPRTVIRGETGEVRLAIIDWISFSIPEEANLSIRDIHDCIRDFANAPEIQLVPSDHGRFGFQQAAHFTIPGVPEPTLLGLIAWGGESQRNRTYVSMSGTWCARLNDWEAFASILARWNVTITRVDIAHDDHAGTRSILDMTELYLSGAFNRGGRRPKARPAGDWIEDLGDGRTLYIGSRKSGKLCRIYEKGRQLGDKESPWVRIEVQLTNKDRYLDIDILTNPETYLAGCYPVLERLSAQPKRIKTSKLIASKTLEQLTEHASIASGRTINALLAQGLSNDEIVNRLVRPGLPKRLRGPVAALPKGTRFAGEKCANDRD